jgi:hypothetical protein
MQINQIKKIRAFLNKEVLGLSEVQAVNGSTIIFDGDQAIEGEKVFTYDGDGNQIALANGTYELENGEVLNVENGEIKSIEKSNAEAQPEVGDGSASDEADTQADNAEANADNAEAESDNQLSAMIEQLIGVVSDLSKKIEAITGKQDSAEVAMSAITKEFEEIKKSPLATSLSKVEPTPSTIEINLAGLPDKYKKAISNLQQK